jgi:hypothetical protein
MTRREERIMRQFYERDRVGYLAFMRLATAIVKVQARATGRSSRSKKSSAGSARTGSKAHRKESQGSMEPVVGRAAKRLRKISNGGGK